MKYKFIVHQFVTPRDRSGNVYSYFAIADTRSGRIIHGLHAHESNLRAAIFDLNGGEHKQNYWFATTEIPKRSFDYYTKDIGYIGCEPSVIANAFRKALRTRKKAKA
jgi:hypothetical protein